MGPPAILLAAWFAINATDEELSPQARGAIQVAPPPAPSETNGYLDYLALGAVEGAPTYQVALSRLRELNDPSRVKNPFPLAEVKLDERIPSCLPWHQSCLNEAAALPHLQALIDGHSVFLRRYRTMREKPQFIELLDSSSPHDDRPSYRTLFEGSRLSRLVAAIKINAGDVTAAIDELEIDNSFHRRLGAGTRGLIQKMVFYALLDQDAVFIAEIARKIPSAAQAHWRRLEGLVRVPAKNEVEIVPGLKHEFAMNMAWMQTRSNVRLPDSHYELAKNFPDRISERPLWDPVLPYLYRPHYSLNVNARRASIVLVLAALPSTEFFKGKEAAEKQLDALEPGLVKGLALSPAGYRHDLLEVFYFDYIARMHTTSGVQTLVRLLVNLKAAGITKHEDVVAALAGPLGRAHPDPFTGGPMRFDPKTETVGFDTQLEVKLFSGAVRGLVERYGRMALPL